MQLNFERLTQVLELDEGRRPSPYTDTEGEWTIGIGHLMANPVSAENYELATGTAVDEPTAIPLNVGSITEEGIDAIFEDDMDTAYDQMRDWLMGDGTASPSSWHRISYLRREILTNMMFQLGPGSVSEFVRCRNAILVQDWHTASLEMRYADPDTERDSDWFRQTRTRCVRAANAMRTNNPQYLLDPELRILEELVD